jgi:hypothetical protein
MLSTEGWGQNLLNYESHSKGIVGYQQIASKIQLNSGRLLDFLGARKIRSAVQADVLGILSNESSYKDAKA